MTAFIKIGSTGSDVRKLTAILKDIGYLQSVSSAFDGDVRKAVRGFQSHHIGPTGLPLEVDGIVGPLTWWALNGAVFTGQNDDLGSIPSGGSSVGRAALRIAVAEMNAGATELGGNNKGRWVRKYLNGLAPEGESWCAGFVSWCYEQAPGAMPFTGEKALTPGRVTSD